MTAQQLITEHLDIWTAAHKTRSTAGRGSNNKLNLHGIKKLRELILELAVRGKLVPQDSKDEPASELLKKIEIEKAKLIKIGAIRKDRDFPLIADDEHFFDLPIGWEWARLEDVGRDWGQKTPEETFTYIDVSAIDNTQGKIVEPTILSAEDAPSRARKIVLKGTVIYSTIRPYLQNIAVIENDFSPEAIASTAFAIMHPLLEMPAKYFSYYLRSPAFISYVESIQMGIAYPAINDKQFYSGVVPIPPLAEQHRIVAKVDELMAFCDQLEQTQSDNIAAHAQLVEGLLATLTDSRDHNELQNNWQRIAAHFDTLFTTEHSIDQLKQTILQLAVMGKLVPQNPNDEPASELLKKIAAEKAQLIKEGKIKKEKPLPEVADEEKPFELPSGWETVRIGELASLSSGKGFKAEEYALSGARLFQIANVSLGFTKWDVENYLPMDYLRKYPELDLKIGDVLIALNRPLLNMQMKVCIISEGDLPSILYQRVGRFNFYGKLIDTRYFYFYLQSGLFINKLNEDLQGSDQPFINQSQVIQFLFPLPPLAEQHRIVTKIDELLTLCDTLKTNLQNAQTTQLALADALVEQALI